MSISSTEYYTQLPTVSSSTLQDVICAVQAGISTQQTLAQVQSLILQNTILYNSGNPNGSLAGTTYQFCWDTTNEILYLCTYSGTSTTALWTAINVLPVTSNFYVVSSNVTMVAGNTYQPNSSSLITLTLPATCALGQTVTIAGFGSGGWRVNQQVSQQIIAGLYASSFGSSGYIASRNQYDSVTLTCVVANTIFQALTPPQGNLTII